MTRTTDASDRAKRSVISYLPLVYFILQIAFGVGLGFWTLFHLAPKTGDDVEHVHSAWLVFQNQVPYIDFFQHHNPLLWYLFAPLVGAMAYDVIILDVVRIISQLVMFGALFLCALMVKRFIVHDVLAGVVTVASVFPSYVIFAGQDFRPDNYMIFSFIVALYLLFCYLETKKEKFLVISFFMAFISFLFMQKVIFVLAVFGAVVLYEMWAGEIKVIDFFKALILPLLMALLFLLWLVKHDMLNVYWLANYIYNLYIPEVYDGIGRVEPTKDEFYVVYVIALFGAVYFVIKGNKYARILTIFWLLESVQRFFYFSLDRHYYYFLQLLDAMLVGGFVAVVIKKYEISAYGFVALFLGLVISFMGYVRKMTLEPHYFRYVTPRYVVENINRCDSVVNGFGLTYNLFAKDVSYYWNLYGELDVIGANIGLSPIPNLNKEIEEKLPKIIYTGPYFDEKKHKEGRDVVVHLVDRRIIDKYYEQSLFVNVFILKNEYQKKRYCRFDEVSKHWKYFYKE